MEIKGKIILALPEVTGVAKATGNPWKKGNMFLRHQRHIPKKSISTSSATVPTSTLFLLAMR